LVAGVSPRTGKTRVMAIRVTEAELEALKAVAAEDERSMSQVARFAIREYCREYLDDQP
jgi:hypothetical protein